MKKIFKKIAKQIKKLNRQFLLLQEKYYNSNIDSNFKKEVIMKNQENSTNIFDVANYIIEKKLELNHLRLHKIIYFAHIQSLLTRGKPLVKTRLEAWLYGPVFPILYRYIEENNDGFIVKPSDIGDCQKLSQEEKEIIDTVVEQVKKYEPFEISDITHQQKPWKEQFDKPIPNCEKEITDYALIKYFSKKNSLFEID